MVFGPFNNSNGKLFSKKTFKDGEVEGLTIGYRRNGQLWFKGSYKNSKKDADWAWYEKDGAINLKKTGTDRNDEKISY